MISDKYQPYRHLSVEDRVMAEMPEWIKIVNKYMHLVNRQYSQIKHQPDDGRRNIST